MSVSSKWRRTSSVQLISLSRRILVTSQTLRATEASALTAVTETLWSGQQASHTFRQQCTTHSSLVDEWACSILAGSISLKQNIRLFPVSAISLHTWDDSEMHAKLLWFQQFDEFINSQFKNVWLCCIKGGMIYQQRGKQPQQNYSISSRPQGMQPGSLYRQAQHVISPSLPLLHAHIQRTKEATITSLERWRWTLLREPKSIFILTVLLGIWRQLQKLQMYFSAKIDIGNWNPHWFYKHENSLLFW